MALKAVGGDMARFLRVSRSAGRTHQVIADHLAAGGVPVNRETVRLWCKRLGVS